eukprot:CAMPEP_0204120604 /NCGR_PEP_ID=MMETSP0361-20130328/7746_1 /ASSEMBLY_ACC=CAM_ASM_000343 /TAXON_ID=268821 /ORGANISM="Scrippsiella Hangoei, Strain SHTV-5" /LENGTH=182 /DNA_ID=CAMNT_0051071831 /DNA_START=10 /DNA_END=555 /DNA_ORIENTATION=-
MSVELIVLEFNKHVPIMAPSWAEVFQAFQDGAGVQFWYETMKKIELTYANLAALPFPHDAVEAWSKLTGCSRECSAGYTKDVEISDSARCHCDAEVVKASQILPDMCNAPANYSFACIKTFIDNYPIPTAGQLRMAFLRCGDMLPVFTGLGFGYNSIVSPLKFLGNLTCWLDVGSRVTGREF